MTKPQPKPLTPYEKRAATRAKRKNNAIARKYPLLVQAKAIDDWLTTLEAEAKALDREETLNGNIVLSVGCDLKGDDWFSQFSAERMEQIKGVLDPLHLEKIKLADEVLVINIGGYIGQSTRNEIKFAESLGKRVRYLEE